MHNETYNIEKIKDGNSEVQRAACSGMHALFAAEKK